VQDIEHLLLLRTEFSFYCDICTGETGKCLNLHLLTQLASFAHVCNNGRPIGIGFIQGGTDSFYPMAFGAAVLYQLLARLWIGPHNTECHGGKTNRTEHGAQHSQPFVHNASSLCNARVIVLYNSDWIDLRKIYSRLPARRELGKEKSVLSQRDKTLCSAKM
jgi:hypothetical protein